jgi:hypothetical protein
MMRWTEKAVKLIREMQGMFVETPAGKRPIGRPQHRWKNNISP